MKILDEDVITKILKTLPREYEELVDSLQVPVCSGLLPQLQFEATSAPLFFQPLVVQALRLIGPSVFVIVGPRNVYFL